MKKDIDFRFMNFGLIILFFWTLAPSLALSQSALQEIADHMEATLKAIGNHVTLFTIQRARGSDIYRGYKKLVLCGRESSLKGRCFREEIYEYEEFVQSPFRQLAVFDGRMSRGFQPVNNTGNIESGQNEFFLMPDDPENYYRRILGAELTDILKSEIDYVKPEPTVRIIDDRFFIVNLIFNAINSQVRYQVTFDKDHGMLPVKIFRQSRPDENSPWKDVLQHSILEWMTLENGVHYPKTGVQTIYQEEIQPTKLEVLSLVRNVDIKAVTDSFNFPLDCQVY
ncbi:MAG: hypothetical protein F9K49_02690, partial [Caedimonadaceae bacterium]